MLKITKYNATAALYISAIFIPQTISAQQISQEIKDEIVVTAKSDQTLSDVLATSHVFDLAAIEAAQADDIPALLDTLVGISSRDSGGRGSATTTFIRGATASQTIVLIDGVRVGSATLGAAALNSYPVEAIERIEVVKGPLSGIYGADGVGGVIQLFTKKSGDGIGSIAAAIGSESLTEFSASLNGGNNENGFHLSIHGEETDGIDRTSIITEGNGDDDSFEETAISFGGQASLGAKTTAKLSVLYTDSTTEFDNTFGSDPGSMTDTKTLSNALNITTEFNEKLHWSTTLGINEDESITNGAFSSDITTNRDSLGSELVLNFNDSNLTVGIDYYEEDIETTNDFPVTERDNTGIYLLSQSKIGNFGLVGSLRYDDNSAYGTDTNSSIAINYNFTDSTRLVASYGTAFSAPSFNFLYFPFFGNPDLLPEESDSIEVSLKSSTDQFDWSISAYQTDVINLFSFDLDTFLAANIGEAELQGIEFNLNTQLAGWNLGIYLDLLSATDLITNTELDDRAEQTFAANASRTWGDFDLGFSLKNERKRFDNGGTELDSYTLFNVNAKYRLTDQLTLFAKIDNLFDEDYTVNLINADERFNTEGRQARLSLKYQF